MTSTQTVEALRRLAAEVGGLKAFDPGVREAIGNTNWTVLMQRLDEAEAALSRTAQAPVDVHGSLEALHLLGLEDQRQDRLHDLLETIREQIRVAIEPAHRPDGLMKNIQDAVYAMRGRTRLLGDAAITAALASSSAQVGAHPLAKFGSDQVVGLGLYRVHWKSGGSSLAAIGMMENGDRWIAPTNWLRPSTMPSAGEWGDIERLEPIEPDYVDQLNALCADFGCVAGSDRLHWLHEQLSELSALRQPKPQAVAMPDGWRCFHCNEVFHDEHSARQHFGATEDREPACQIKLGAERSMLAALRRAEADAADAWFKLQNESGEAAQAYYAQASRHQEQLRAAEELGYERGLRDASPLPSSSGTGWRPIETAPKDGTRFLAYTDDGIDFFHWQDHQREGSPVGWRDSFIRVYRENDPTGPGGWMPLPTAPVSHGGDHG